ncbi:MAG: peptide ABC transporter substrate-binding protein [Bdellovibrionales bacterium]
MIKKSALTLGTTLFLIISPLAKSAPNNKELKIGISQEFENLNPMIMTMSATAYIFSMVGRTLTTLDSNLKWVPQLAKEIPSLEKGTAKIVEQNGKKKVVVQWEILSTATWGDGVPVTCQDFAFSRTVALSPNVSIGEKELYTKVEKIEWDPKSPKKCTFTYDKARWDFVDMARFFPLPKHIEEPLFLKYSGKKEGYEKNSLYVKNPTNPGLYNGPYKITEVKLGDHVTLEPNPQWKGVKPKIQKIIVKLIPNTGTLEANLRSGQIDMIGTLGLLAMDQALNLEKKVKSDGLDYIVHFTPSITYEHIDLNLDNPILSDVRVRQALLFAINREEMVQALFEGKQQVAEHLISPKDPWYSSDPKKIKLYRYSRREAQKLLDAAGWVPGADGIRVKNGKRLSLTFMTTAGNKSRELVQVYLQEQWKQAGIDVTIKNEPARVYFSETTKKRKFPALAMYAWVSTPENNPKSLLASKNIPTEKNGWSGQNYPGWSNKEVDQTCEALDIEFNANQRKLLAEKILRNYTEEVPVIPLFYRSDTSVVPPGLKNYRPTGHQYSETNEIEHWTF